MSSDQRNPQEAAERRRIMITAAVMLLVLVGGAAGSIYYFLQMQGGSDEAAAHQQEAVERPQEEFVGSAKCAECHADIAKQYADSRKAQSVTTLADARKIENYQAGVLPGKPFSYRVEQTEDGVKHHEFVTGVYDLAKPINYVLGSGERQRSYISAEGGELFLSPVVWNGRDDKWQLAAADPANPPHFDIRVTDDCLRCHAGAVNSAGLYSDMYRTPPFAEAAIGCEKCHGAGGAHVAKHEANANATNPNAAKAIGGNAERDDSILNPAHLGSRRVDHLCASCHAKGIDTIPRYGASLLDFRPGDLLEDVFAVMANNPQNDAEFQGSGHHKQLKASACFQRSQSMTCVTCHDAHGDPPKAERPAFFNAKCNKCHTEQGCSEQESVRLAAPANGSCIHCHMPVIEQNQVIHSVRVDHRVRRRPQDTDGGKPRTKVEHLHMYDNGQDRVDNKVSTRANALAMMNLSLATGEVAAARRLALNFLPKDRPPSQSLSEMKDDAPLVVTLGTTMALANAHEPAGQCFQQVLDSFPYHEEALLGMTRNALRENKSEDVLKFTQQWLDQRPAASGPRAFRVVALKELGRTDDAIVEAEAIIKRNPSNMALRRWLRDAYNEVGREEDAEKQSQVIQRLEALGVKDGS